MQACRDRNKAAKPAAHSIHQRVNKHANTGLGDENTHWSQDSTVLGVTMQAHTPQEPTSVACALVRGQIANQVRKQAVVLYTIITFQGGGPCCCIVIPFSSLPP